GRVVRRGSSEGAGSALGAPAGGRQKFARRLPSCGMTISETRRANTAPGPLPPPPPWVGSKAARAAVAFWPPARKNQRRHELPRDTTPPIPPDARAAPSRPRDPALPRHPLPAALRLSGRRGG